MADTRWVSVGPNRVSVGPKGGSEPEGGRGPAQKRKSC